MLFLDVSPPSSTAVLLLGIALTLGVILVSAWLVLLGRGLRRQERHLAALARLERIERLLGRLAEGGGELDLRRLEHVLIDLRDGQERLEGRLVRLLETAAGQGRDSSPVGERHPSGGDLSERITTRLLSLGYERIEIVTPLEAIEALSEAEEGEVVVEARRGGAPYKGRVLVKHGTLCDVRLRSSYEAFP